jgi:hypothetical protein
MGGFPCGHNLQGILLSVHLKSNQIRGWLPLRAQFTKYFTISAS